jgi:ribokinase
VSRVHVLGNAGLDIGLHLQRLPVRGETLVGRAGQQSPGGKGLNQAVAAVRAGAAVRFMAPVGGDSDATAIRTALAAEPFETVDLPVLPFPTDRSILMLLPDGENAIVTLGDCAHGLDPAMAAAFAGSVRPDEILLMQGNLSAEATRAAAAVCAGRVVLNTAPLRWDVTPLLSLCAVVIANQVEAESVAGQASAAALRAAGAAVAVVTMGAWGCLFADADGERRLPAPPARVLDSTGAGDAFCGTLAALLARSWPWTAALEAAQRVAARTVERPGAYAALPPAAEWPGLLEGTAA